MTVTTGIDSEVQLRSYPVTVNSDRVVVNESLSREDRLGRGGRPGFIVSVLFFLLAVLRFVRKVCSSVFSSVFNCPRPEVVLCG